MFSYTNHVTPFSLKQERVTGCEIIVNLQQQIALVSVLEWRAGSINPSVSLLTIELREIMGTK